MKRKTSSRITIPNTPGWFEQLQAAFCMAKEGDTIVVRNAGHLSIAQSAAKRSLVKVTVVMEQ
jgi:hypothetical protein